MLRRAPSRSVLIAALAFALSGGSGTPANAESDAIAAGFDLFDTADGTSLGLRFADLDLPAPAVGADVVTFTGVPLRQYSFPATGPVATGDTDTIVERTTAGGVGSPIPMRVAALQLVSTNTPVPFYVTLDPQRESAGTIVPTVTGPDGGRFTADLTVNYQVRQGSLNGPVVLTNSVTFTSSSAFGRVFDVERQVAKMARNHRHVVRPAFPPIAGVNALLNGFDSRNDFVPGDPVTA